MTERVEIQCYQSIEDPRGTSFALGDSLSEFLSTLRDCHVASVRPGATRGDHAHEKRREVILVLYESEWVLYWDDEVGSSVKTRNFHGCGLVVVRVMPGAAHAIKNTGTSELIIVSLSDEEYDPSSGETIRRNVSQ